MRMRLSVAPTLAVTLLTLAVASGQGFKSERFGGMDLQGRPAKTVVEPLPLWHLDGSEKDPAFGFLFSMRWSGSLDVPEDGAYVFRVHADDGVRLLVDGQLLVDTWDLKGGQIRESKPIALTAGTRATFCLEYYQRLSDQFLDVQWKTPGGAAFEPLPVERQHTETPSWPLAVTSVRFHPAKGHTVGMVGGRFTGSTKAPTAEVTVLATITNAPAEDQWVEMPVANAGVFRYLKYEGPKGSHAAIAELQFLHDGKPITGTPFGTTGSQDGQPNSFANAFDGDMATVSTGNEPDTSYAGLDLGEQAVAGTPRSDPPPGNFPRETLVALSVPGGAGFIRYTVDGSVPTWDSGRFYTAPIAIGETATIQARSFVPGLAPSVVAMLPVTISAKPMEKGLRTFHTGNSLQAAINAFLIPMAQSAGYDHFKANSGCAGAPTDWIYNKLKDEQWGPMLKVEGIATDLPGNLANGWLIRAIYRPTATWDDAMRNHIRYFEILRAELASRYPGQDVPIIPVGVVLLKIKEQMAAGTLAGFAKDDDFFARFYADNIHQNATGEYLTTLVHFACLYQKDPTGIVTTIGSNLSAAQAETLQKLVWETVTGYRWAFVKAETAR